jgi:hypothetical protein
LKAILGNVEMKLDRINFLDEAIRDKQESVGPGVYKPKVIGIDFYQNLERSD